MGKQCWSQAVLESGSWGHSVLQTPALVFFYFFTKTYVVGYSLEVPRGASNDYHNVSFLGEIRTNISCF